MVDYSWNVGRPASWESRLSVSSSKPLRPLLFRFYRRGTDAVRGGPAASAAFVGSAEGETCNKVRAAVAGLQNHEEAEIVGDP